MPCPCGPASSGSLRRPAAAMTGVARRNANRAASSWVRPRSSPAVMVAPERLIPGSRATRPEATRLSGVRVSTSGTADVPSLRTLMTRPARQSRHCFDSDDLFQGVRQEVIDEGVHDHCVTNDLDTLATALYVRTDDLLKEAPDLAPWRPRVGIAPKLTDAELVTLAVLQALLGFTSEARWMRYAHQHLGHLFRYLPRQPGYNKRLRRAAALITTIIRMLAVDTTLWSDDVWVVDSTPVECGRSKDTTRRSDLAG